MKRCKRCGRVLDESEFNKHKNTKDGLQSYCKECQHELNRMRIKPKSPQLKVPQIGGGQSQPGTCGVHPKATHGRTQSPRLHRRAEIHADNQAMTTEHGTKCCGSCRHFTNEDALGLGWCALNECETTCGSQCKGYENKRKTFIKQTENDENKSN